MFMSWTICPRSHVIHRTWHKIQVFVLSQLEIALSFLLQGTLPFRKAGRLPC